MIKFSKPSSELTKEYNNMNVEDKKKLSTINISSLIDIDDESGYECYIICEDKDIEKYKKILNSNKILYICDNISQKVISGEITLEKYIKQKLDSINKKFYKEFIKNINMFITNNLTLDNILDKISDSGIKSLNKLEKKYLKNYK
jgi:NAD(P)H-nitrite reductase large subunit